MVGLQNDLGEAARTVNAGQLLGMSPGAHETLQSLLLCLDVELHTNKLNPSICCCSVIEVSPF
jgi:hypothetical protein